VDFVVDRVSGVVVLQPSGRLDASESQELQQIISENLAENERALVIDLVKTAHISGAGIRILMNLGKKLGSRGGGLILCSLSDDLKRAFNVAGVANQFATAGSREDAVRLLQAAEKVSRLSDEAAQLLAGAEERNTSNGGSE
jgi:anti-sigma B factor antagonist